jgi:hypothetical protein
VCDPSYRYSITYGTDTVGDGRNGGERNRGHFGYVFILKEVGMHLTMKDNTTRVQGISLVHSTVAVFCWVVSEIAFCIVGGGAVFDTRAVGDAVYIARMSPHLYMALITLTRIN